MPPESSRTEILQLVAMNQLDLIEPMMTSETDRAFLKSILESRKNLRDRFNFEAADLAPPLQRTSSPAKAGDPVFQSAVIDREAAAYWILRFAEYDESTSYENSRDRDARHNVHSVRNRDVTCGANGSLSARDIRSRSRPTSASGRNTGLTSGGTLCQQRERRLQMPARFADQLIQRRAQFRRLLAREHLFHRRCRGCSSNCSGTNN